MQTQTTEEKAPELCFLPGFRPLSFLWEGANPLFPSSHSARWTINRMRDALNREGAIAKHRGHLFLHVEKFERIFLKHSQRNARYDTLDA